MRRINLTNSLAIFCFVLLSLKAYCKDGRPANANIFNSTTNYQDSLQNAEKQYFVLPFHLIDGFILIDVTINDKEGKLMFDTGTPFSYFLNNNKVNLDKHNKIAEGQAGSGQKIVLFKSDSLLSIEFNDRLSFSEQGSVHADFGFVEKGITPEFFGFIGYGFFKDYEFILDYDNQVIEFFRIDEKGNSPEKTKKTPDNIVGMIDFENDKNVNIPEFQMQIGSTQIPAYFDTGDQGDLTLTSDTKKAFNEKKLIVENKYPAWYGEYVEGKSTFNLKESQIQGIPIMKVKNLNIDEGENKANLGYQFLKLYKTVWNFKTKTIMLLER